MFNPNWATQSYEDENENQTAEQSDSYTADQSLAIPQITIDDPDQNQTVTYNSSSSTETEMSSSHRSPTHISKGKHSSTRSKSKAKKDDWSEITDPEERRRVQNRIAQRKFRDKARDRKEQQDRDTLNRSHAHHSYLTPDPTTMAHEDALSGLPWGSFSLQHVFSSGLAKESESRRHSGSASNSNSKSLEEEWNSTRYTTENQPTPQHEGFLSELNAAVNEGAGFDDDRVYYDYASGGSGGSAHGGSSR